MSRVAAAGGDATEQSYPAFVSTRLLFGAAALALLVIGIGFGLWPKEIHIAECGSPFFPADSAGLSLEAAGECKYALGKRYTVLWVVFIGSAALGVAAAVTGMRNPSTPVGDRADASAPDR